MSISSFELKSSLPQAKSNPRSIPSLSPTRKRSSLSPKGRREPTYVLNGEVRRVVSDVAQESTGIGRRLLSSASDGNMTTQMQRPIVTVRRQVSVEAPTHGDIDRLSQYSVDSNHTSDRDRVLATLSALMRKLLDQHRSAIVSRVQEMERSHEATAEKLRRELCEKMERSHEASAEKLRRELCEKIEKLECILTTTEKSVLESVEEETQNIDENLDQLAPANPMSCEAIEEREEEEMIQKKREEQHISTCLDAIEEGEGEEPEQDYLSQHAAGTMQMLSEPFLQRTSSQKDRRSLLRRLTGGSMKFSAFLDVAMHTAQFEAVVGFVIVLNAIFMGYRVDHKLRHYEQHLHDSVFVEVVGELFNIFFIVELILRLVASGCHNFAFGKDQFWNIMDTIIVFSIFFYACIGLFSTPPFVDPSIFRMLRLMRIVRIVKLARLTYFLHELRNILLSIAGGMRILFWAMVLLSLMYYAFGLVIMTAISHHLGDPPTEALKMYGTVGDSMLTLYMATTGGIDWSEAADPLKVLGSGYYLAYLLFNAFVSMALLNVVMGSFVDATMKASIRDYVQEMQSEAEDFHMYRESVLNFFMKLNVDPNADGELTFNELQQSLGNPIMESFLRHVGYQRHEAETLHRAMQQATGGKVYTECFVDACLRLGRNAKGFDAMLTNNQLVTIRDMLQKLREDHRHAMPMSNKADRTGAPLPMSTSQ